MKELSFEEATMISGGGCGTPQKGVDPCKKKVWE